MKKFAAVLFLLLCTASLQAKDKPNPANYTIKMHISGSHLKPTYPLGTYLQLETNLNGKKIELLGPVFILEKHNMLLVPGDYPAKLIDDTHNPNGAWFVQTYELLLPDGTI